MNIKEMFKNAKTKVNEMKLVVVMKGFFGKIFHNKYIENVMTSMKNMKAKCKDFLVGHQNIKDCMAGDVSHRFSTRFKKFFRNISRKISNKVENGSKLAKFASIAIKIFAILATIAFIALVIYCIKDVFIYCLMLVATCAAVAISIEFILSILSIATGCKI